MTDTGTTPTKALTAWWWRAISGQDGRTKRVLYRCGNQTRTLARHSSSLIGGPPGSSRASSAGPTYFRMVLRSTPRLRLISAWERPAYQWVRISTMSTTVNVLLISSPSSVLDEGELRFRGPGWGRRSRGWELADRHGPLGEEFRDRQQPRCR